MRLGYIDRTTAHPYALEVLERNRQEPESTLHLIRTWGWSPWLQEQLERMGHYLHNRTSVDHRMKEIVIVRACTRNYSPYELFHHVPLAFHSGLTVAEVSAIQSFAWEESENLTEEQKTCVRYVDEFDGGRGVQQNTIDRMRAYFAPEQVLSISLQTGFWGANARLMNAVQAQKEPWRVAGNTALLEAGQRNNSPMAPRQPAPVPAPAAGSRIGMVSDDAATPKNANWFGRWAESHGPVPNLVRVWALNEHLQASQQMIWDVFAGPNISLERRELELVANRVSWLNFSPYLIRLLHAQGYTRSLSREVVDAVHGDFQAASCLSKREKLLLTFVDTWDAGLGVSDELFQSVYAHYDRRRMTEIQIATGFFGIHARLAKALSIEPEH